MCFPLALTSYMHVYVTDYMIYSRGEEGESKYFVPNITTNYHGRKLQVTNDWKSLL